jgi:hypothetical protein
MILQLEKYFEEKNVVKTLFISGANDIEFIYNQLIDSNHAVININNLQEILDFNNSNYRIALIHITLLSQYKQNIAQSILPFQNLIVLDDINEYELVMLQNWIQNASKDGLINQELLPEILNLDYL